MATHRDLVVLAERVAERAARFIREAERPDPAAWDRKEAADFVTHIDRESERMIRDELLGAHPHSAVMGEELGPEDSAADLLWIVDPLDGTTNYLHGYPAYAVSIGIRVRGKLIGGVVVDVDREVRYSGYSGAGARSESLGPGPSDRNGQLSVSPVSDPALALIGTGFPFKHPALLQLERWKHEFFHVLAVTSGIRRAGSAALDLVDVARGRFDGFWEYGLAPWDLAAGAVLVREAGGRVTDLDGNDLHGPPAHGPLVAGNPAIHAWLLTTLRSLHGD